MKKVFLAAALLSVSALTYQTKAANSVITSQSTIKGPETWVMEGWVFIVVSENIVDKIVVTNAKTGALVARSECYSNECSVDLKPLPAGAYNVEVSTEKGAYTVRIVK